ncbi:hypothetical protein QFZ51_005983 [Chitinophaga sp. W3I9]
MKKLLYIVIVLAFTLVSCTKFSDSINRNPESAGYFFQSEVAYLCHP